MDFFFVIVHGAFIRNLKIYCLSGLKKNIIMIYWFMTNWFMTYFNV